LGGRDCIARARRHVDHDAAGRLAPPLAGEGGDLGTLHAVEGAALLADEELDRARTFLDGNRVALTIVDRRRTGYRLHGLAACEHDADAGGRRQPGRRGAPRLRDPGMDGTHRSSPLRAVSPG